MKKLLCLLLVLCMFPFVSLADDPDPIVGFWYVIYDVSQYPEDMQAAFRENIHIRDSLYETHVFWFTENGEIYSSTTHFRTHQSEANGSGIIGTWSKGKKGKYTTVISSTISLDSAYIENGILYAKYLTDYYVAFRKMEPLDFSKDLRNK